MTTSSEFQREEDTPVRQDRPQIEYSSNHAHALVSLLIQNDTLHALTARFLEEGKDKEFILGSISSFLLNKILPDLTEEADTLFLKTYSEDLAEQFFSAITRLRNKIRDLKLNFSS